MSRPSLTPRPPHPHPIPSRLAHVRLYKLATAPRAGSLMWCSAPVLDICLVITSLHIACVLLDMHDSHSIEPSACAAQRCNSMAFSDTLWRLDAFGSGGSGTVEMSGGVTTVKTRVREAEVDNNTTLSPSPSVRAFTLGGLQHLPVVGLYQNGDPKRHEHAHGGECGLLHRVS